MLRVHSSSSNGAVSLPDERPFEMPLAVRIATAPVRKVTEWVWEVVVLRAKSDGLALTLLFLGSLGIFPVWIGLAMAVSGVVMVSLRLSKAESDAAEFRDGYYRLQGERRKLREDNRELRGKVSDIRTKNETLEQKRENLEKERDAVIQRRQELILEQVSLTAERDQLGEENRKLKQEREEWVGQKEQLVAVAKKKGEELVRVLGEVDSLHVQLERSGHHVKLNEHLARFHELYQAVIQGEEDPKSMTREALETLLPEWKEHREGFHRILQRAMETLPKDGPAQVPLYGILELSRQEMEYAEKIGETLHLIPELRKSLNQLLFQQEIEGSTV